TVLRPPSVVSFTGAPTHSVASILASTSASSTLAYVRVPSGRATTARPVSAEPSRPWTTEYVSTSAGPLAVSVIGTGGSAAVSRSWRSAGGGATGPGSVDQTPATCLVRCMPMPVVMP